MTYKIILPNKTEMKFEEKDGAIRAAKENSTKKQKVISVQVEKNGEWEQVAIVYPNGLIQEGTGGFGFFKRLPTKKRQ